MKLYFYLVGFILLATSCVNDKADSTNDNTITSIETDTLKNSYAEAFRIIEHEDSTEIQIINIENKEVEFKYFIGVGEDNNSIKLNPGRVVALSSTHIGMMEELQLLDKIVGISSDKYLCSSSLKKRVEQGKASTVGDIGNGDVEGYLAVRPDLIIYSGFDTKAAILQKLKSAGLKTFTNYDWKETHPLGRAEWLKIFGVIFNKRKEANSLFDKIESKYLALVDKMKKTTRKPSVLVGTMYGDVFNTPAGESYMAKLLTDANSDYQYASTSGTGSLSLSLEEIISDNRNVDVWLNVAAQTKSDIVDMNKKFNLLNAFQKDKVYSYYKNVNCFWEKSAVQPHIVLKDFCKIFHPNMFEDDDLVFYHQLE
ncbi:MAG: ABC transporter substrate-binding protein [Brumimicrobium sp.]